MYNLGSLEEIVLLLVMSLEENAYGVSVANEYKSRTGNDISIPAIHTVLRRLEEKSFLKSKHTEASAERGGRRKRVYGITPLGYRTVSEVQNQRDSLWSTITKPSF